jgi:hypothetical protein
VKIQGYFVLVDFVVLDMETMKESPLILGRPFLNTTGAQIDVGAGEICFNNNGKEEKFDFWPKQEQCSMIRIKYEMNPKGIKEVEIQPQLVDSLIKKNKENKKRSEQKKNNPKQKGQTPKVVPKLPKMTKGGNKKKKLQSPPPHHQNQTKWCGDQRRCNHMHLLLRARMSQHQAKSKRRRVLLTGLKTVSPC